MKGNTRSLIGHTFLLFSLVWEIIGSILGVVIVTVGVTACYCKRRRGQAGNVIRRNQPVEANPSMISTKCDLNLNL